MTTSESAQKSKKRKRLHECSVCLDVIEKNGDSAKTPCGHRFHLTCLMQSVRAGTLTCPLCRGDIIKSEEEPKEEEEEEEETNDGDQNLRELPPYVATLRLADDNFAKLKASIESMCVILFLWVYIVPFAVLALTKVVT